MLAMIRSLFTMSAAPMASRRWRPRLYGVSRRYDGQAADEHALADDVDHQGRGRHLEGVHADAEPDRRQPVASLSAAS